MRLVGPLLAILVVCSLLAPVAGGAMATNDGAGAAASLQGADSADTTMRIDLQSDGAARWNVTMRFALEEGDHKTFEELIAEYEAGTASEGPNVSTFEALAERGSDATGRSMTISNVERSGGISGDVGRLSLTFTWTRFAAVFPGELIVGDAFDAWELDAGQRLVVSPPSGYLLQSFDPGTDRGVNDGVVRWDGPVSFGDDEPRIEYASTGPSPPPTTTSTTSAPGNGTTSSTPNGPTSPSGPGGENGSGTAALGALALVAILGSGYVLYRQRESELPANGDDGAEPDAAADDTGGDAAAGATGTAGAAGASTDESESDSEPGETLLSDEERVLRLLESNGGRMKQANIVTETDWSNAKVSQLLSRMAEEEQVEKLRIGRENLISLPEDEE